MGDKKTTMEIPDYEIESFARCLLPAIREYFHSDEGQKEFAAWKLEMDKGDKTTF